MAKHPKDNKAHGRNYSRDTRYENLPEQIKNREVRNNARHEVLHNLEKKHNKKIAKHMLVGKDVDHRKALIAGGSTAKSNLRLRSIHSNRGDKTY